MEKTDIKSLDYEEPVSYTHLDVYKRQEGDSIRMAPDGRDGTADLRDGADLPDACGAQGAAKSDAAAFRSERIRAKHASSESIPAICSRYDL